MGDLTDRDRRTLSDPQRLLWRDDVEGICPTPGACQSARPMSLDWARSMKRQSEELGRVFNFKQVGGRGGDKGGHELDGRTYFNRPTPRPSKEVRCE